MVVTSLEDHRQHTSAPAIPATWIRPLQFSQATGMPRRSVYDELAAGRLRGVQVGNSWFIRIEELEDYFERHGLPAA